MIYGLKIKNKSYTIDGVADYFSRNTLSVKNCAADSHCGELPVKTNLIATLFQPNQQMESL